MALIDDDVRGQQAAENAGESTSAPEEEVIGRPQPVAVNKSPKSMNVTLPVCGNPVTDFDKMNEMNENNEAQGTSSLVTDPVSLMEMGNPLESQENAFEQVNLDKINKSQKNVTCDEVSGQTGGICHMQKLQPEQINFLKKRKLDQFNNSDLTILGPVSKGEFVSFNQNLPAVVGCDLGILNPMTPENYQYYLKTSDGQLLSAIPRTCYVPSDRIQKRQISAPTSVRKLPSTLPIRAPALSPIKNPADSEIASNYRYPLFSGLHPIEASNKSQKSLGTLPNEDKGEEENASSEAERIKSKRVHKQKKEDSAEQKTEETFELKTEEVTEAAKQEATEAAKQELTEMAKQEAAKAAKQETSEATKQEAAETAKQETAEATKQGAAEAAKQKAKEITKQEAEEAAKQKGSRANLNEKTEKPSSGVGSAQQDDSSKNQQSSSNARRLTGQGSGKNKKTEKGVSSEYTVAQPPDGDRGLERTLKELGIIDVSELIENPSKKKKGNKKNKQQQQQQQQQQKKQGKEAAGSTNDKEGNNDGADNKNQQKEEKKMDEVADAGSVANRTASGAGQQSEEDDDQSYVSAQENLGGSNSQLSTPPEFADAPQANDHDNVMNDPGNYRDEEGCALVALQLQKEEDAFITVGKNNKKYKTKGTPQENAPASSTSSSTSPSNRRNTHPDTRASSSATGSNNASSSGSGQSSHNQYQRSNNRPVAHATTLGDFMDATKKETHKNTKHRKSGGPTPPISQKKQASLDDAAPASPTSTDAVGTPISVNTTPTFSYADVAKKTSGENTPAIEMSPVPAVPPTTSATSPDKNQPMSSASQSSSSERKKPQETVTPKAQPSPKPFSTAVSGVQLPASVTATACDISFGYEETPEDKLKRERKEAEAAASQKETTVSTPSPQKPHMPTRMNGDDFMKTFNEGSGQNTEATLQEMPKGHVNESVVLSAEIIKSFKTQWEKFESTGSKPVMYTPTTRN
ncbi:CBN-SPAT-2 protein [Caenorhabditis brenneri]|uniref:CBN-SPAT-2 protein n=1 Tax=Caenorhabditis brenneri TaxID=135651 RepID=G0ML87_CAEBE|nr:CBN-SPAT-2 protein [Caenorhabditis brenneri]